MTPRDYWDILSSPPTDGSGYAPNYIPKDENTLIAEMQQFLMNLGISKENVYKLSKQELARDYITLK